MSRNCWHSNNYIKAPDLFRMACNLCSLFVWISVAVVYGGCAVLQALRQSGYIPWHWAGAFSSDSVARREDARRHKHNIHCTMSCVRHTLYGGFEVFGLDWGDFLRFNCYCESFGVLSGVIIGFESEMICSFSIRRKFHPACFVDRKPKLRRHIRIFYAVCNRPASCADVYRENIIRPGLSVIYIAAHVYNWCNAFVNIYREYHWVLAVFIAGGDDKFWCSVLFRNARNVSVNVEAESLRQITFNAPDYRLCSHCLKLKVIRLVSDCVMEFMRCDDWGDIFAHSPGQEIDSPAQVKKSMHWCSVLTQIITVCASENCRLDLMSCCVWENGF